jgi:hypothetical protein
MAREAISATVGAAATERLLVPAPAGILSNAVSDTTVGADVSTLGVKQTTTLTARGVRAIDGRVQVQVSWTVGGAGIDGNGRVNATLLRNGAAITGAVAVNGPIRSLATGGAFVETLDLQVPNGLKPNLGDTLAVVLTLEVTTVGAGVRTLAIDHDPPAGARCIVFGLD